MGYLCKILGDHFGFHQPLWPEVTPLPADLESLSLPVLRRLETRTHHEADRSQRRGRTATEAIQRAKVVAIRAVIARKRAEEDAAREAAGLPLDRYPERRAGQ